ncbi:hypothetical protein [Kutzneria chonburiensis]|uniref:Uncharacterized protein n=1 Tax=Kutzneria chonburiensis TaxID=1483604 RepID=A0ABV6N4H1_9PSEU|nr:hypothetical protein [Kutzneria chonburiensis]
MSLKENAAAQVAGLRALADLIESNPDLLGTSTYMRALNIWWALDAKQLADIARAGLAHGATVSKTAYGDTYSIGLDFGAVTAHALAIRTRVCERVVLGVDTVTRHVPDPDALANVPTVEVTETVERVEWKCVPLLAEATVDGAA